MSKEYKVRCNDILFNYFGFGLLITIFVYSLINLSLDSSYRFRWLFILLYVLALITQLCEELNLTHTIIFDESGKLFFKSLIQKREFEIKEIQSIKASFGDEYYLKFKTNKRSMRVINRFDGLNELINDLKNINPNIEIKGFRNI